MSSTASSTPRRKSGYPGSLTDLHRFRRTAHGHDGASRIVMVRKTDQRTYASIKKGQEPKYETITRETVETFRGQRTECKITTEKKNCEQGPSQDLILALHEINSKVPKKISTLKSSTRGVNKKRSMEFEHACLHSHNVYREKHGASPLKLSREICREAQKWAEHLLARGALQHSPNNKYGENLYGFTSSDVNATVSGNEPVDSWYAEIKDHQFGTEMDSLVSGHFTQVVWRDSKELGVGHAKKGGRVIVVCNYYPPGNIIGQFADQVKPIGTPVCNSHKTSECLSDKIQKLTITSKLQPSRANGTEGNFEEDFLCAHNEYRKRHGVPCLKLDKKLCKAAQEWASHLASKNILEHRPGSNYGENIYCIYSSDPGYCITGHAPVDSWYEEVHKHPFGKEPNSLASGHFTQVIWKSSEYLGVGVAKNGHGRIFVVGNYSPAGNFVGHYVENVPSPITPIKEKKDSGDDTKQYERSESSCSDSDFSQFALDGLKVHNEYRRKHGVPELVLSKKLCAYAQEWADTCARTGSMTHRANNCYGENIFCVYSSDYSHIPSARDAVQEWYNEVKKHTFDTEIVNHGTLHFTQVVWRESRELGMAMGRDKKGQTFVVANYDPRGNMVGKFKANVPKPKA